MQKKRSRSQSRSAAGKKRWARDEEKEAFWREHIDEWKASGQSKRGYCLERGVSESSFNAWRREIELRDREKALLVSGESTEAAERPAPSGPFVPLQLVSERSAAAGGAPAVASNGKAIEVLVPGGAVLIVEESCSVTFAAESFQALRKEN